MPRLIILLITLASLTLLTVQNLGEDKAVPLVVLGTPISSIPLGLLLLAAVGTGALTTLVLYGLVGLYRPAASIDKSKYKPMGSRIPDPESPTSTSNPYSTSTASNAPYSSGNTAFVTEPPADTPVDRASTSSTATASPSQPASSTSSAGNPKSNIYSPFSRDKDTAAKKKDQTLE